MISFQKPSYVIKESIGKASLVLERTKGTDGTVSVTWTTKDQSAINGKDYFGGSGTVTFEHAEQIKTVDIEINDDKDFEKDESFVIELRAPTGGATLGRLQKTIVTIVNDDGKLSLKDLGSVVRKVNCAIHRIVIFKNFLNMFSNW